MYQQQSSIILAKAIKRVVDRRVFNLLKHGIYEPLEEINTKLSENPHKTDQHETIQNEIEKIPIEDFVTVDKKKRLTGDLIHRVMNKTREMDVINSIKSHMNQHEPDNNKKSHSDLGQIIRPQMNPIKRALLKRHETISYVVRKKKESKRAKRRELLRIGDIIYLQLGLNHGFHKNIIDVFASDRSTVVLSADGIVSNRIECLPSSSNTGKSAHFLFKKCLFQVECAKNYKYAELYKQELRKTDGHLEENLEIEHKLDFLKQKAEEENRENLKQNEYRLGAAVIYGQSIQLRHIYSGCLVTVNPFKLAREQGNFELALDPTGSTYSNFRIINSLKLKSHGEAVQYSDYSTFVSAKDRTLFFHIWEENSPSKSNTIDVGLEVNCGEIESHWKIQPFTKYETVKIQKENRDYCITSGSFIKILHAKSKSYLKLSQKQLTTLIVNKNVFIQTDSEDSYQQKKSVQIKVIESNRAAQHSVFLKEENDKNFSLLWEIQRKNTFQGYVPSQGEFFRIKNVATGLFLCQDRLTDQLIVTTNGNLEECYFKFQPKRKNKESEAIRYSELLRVQTFKDFFLQSVPREHNNDQKIFCGPKKSDSTELYFIFEEVSDKMTQTASRVVSLFPYFNNFYQFVQSWGVSVTKQSQSEEILTYQYSIALQTENDLEFEVVQFERSLENLEDFILKENEDFTFQDRQNLLFEQNIIEMLLLIAELLDAKMFASKNKPDKEGRLVRIQTADANSDWIHQEKSPFYVAHRFMAATLSRIYRALSHCIQDNPAASEFILKHDSFLSGQLLYYKKEVGFLLKEAIKNSVSLSQSDLHGEQIIEWINLLEMIKETEANIELQILYLEIIGLASVDFSSKKGIPKYQNKVLSEFFSPNSNTLLKGLIHFKLLPETATSYLRPYIWFSKDKDISEEKFRDCNPSLSYSNSEKTNFPRFVLFQNKAHYSLEELSQFSNLKSFDIILDYIVAVLRLNFRLCKGRNTDAIDKLQSIGLDHELLYTCMRSERIHIKLRTAFILLYEVLFIDVQPFSSIYQSANRCYIWEDIQKKDLNSFTYRWISSGLGNEDSDSEERFSNLNSFLSEFWFNGQGIIDKEQLSTKKGSEDSLLQSRLLHLQAMLQLTKGAINFGLTVEKINNEISYVITHIFSEFNSKESKIGKEFWLSKFLTIVYKQLQKRKDAHFTSLLLAIYDEALSIVSILSTLRLNLQVIKTLRFFKYHYDHGIQLSRIAYLQFFNSLFSAIGVNAAKNTKSKLATSFTTMDRDDERRSTLGKIGVKSANLSRSENTSMNISSSLDVADINTSPKDFSPGSFFLLNFLSEMPYESTYLEQKATFAIVEFLTQRERLWEGLNQIELICGEVERDIFNEFDGNSSKGQLIAPDRLDYQITKVLQDDELLKQSYKIDIAGHKNKIIDINNTLNKIISKFRSRRKDATLFARTQNILRNLHVHKSIIKIFKLNYKEKDHKELFKSAIEVLCRFCLKNPFNQKELYLDIDEFLGLVSYRLQPAKLISLIFYELKRTEKCLDLVDRIFQILDKAENLQPHYCEYLLILRTLILDSKKSAVREVQRRIMTKIVKNKYLLGIIEGTFIETKSEKKMVEAKIERLQDEILQISLQAEMFLLISNLATDSKVQILQFKEMISYDQFRLKLSDPNLPFVLKKSFLRFLFEIYICNVENVNKDLEVKNLNEIFVYVILPDLQIYANYIEGLQKVSKENVEKRKKAQEIKSKLALFKSKLNNSDSKDEKNLMTSSIINNPILSKTSAYAESRRILEDQSEYWDYLNGGKSWDLRRDGLLYFLIDCFFEISARQLVLDEKTTEALSSIKNALFQINRMLFKIEEEVKISLSKYTILINNCIDHMPERALCKINRNLDEYSRRYEEQQYQREEFILHLPFDATIDQNKPSGDIFALVTNKIKIYLLKKKITIEDFGDMFMAMNDKITIEEFKLKLKGFLGNLIAINEIDEFMNFLKKKSGNLRESDEISLSKQVLKKFKKAIERERVSRFKDMIKEEMNVKIDVIDNPDSTTISRQFKNFVNAFTDYCIDEQTNEEVNDFIDRLFKSLNDYLSERKELHTKRFISKLRRAFENTSSTLYFLQIIKNLLQKCNYEIKSGTVDQQIQEQDQRLKRMQKIMDDSGISKLCLDIFLDTTNLDTRAQATEVLVLLLDKGNHSLQHSILSILKTGKNGFRFFNLLKNQYWTYLSNYQTMKARKPSSKMNFLLNSKFDPNNENISLELTQQRLVIKSLKLIQLFCEGICSDFQNYIREQKKPTNEIEFTSSNLLNDITMLLVNLQQTDENFLQNIDVHLDSAIHMLKQAFETLTDACIGPCQENQRYFGKQQHLWKLVNSILDCHIDFSIENDRDEDLIQLFESLVKFLNSIYNGNDDSAAKQTIIRRIHIKSLTSKLKQIFTSQISVKKFSYFLQSQFDDRELIVLKTGFYIYILLTMMKEEFPALNELSIFEHSKFSNSEKLLLKRVYNPKDKVYKQNSKKISKSKQRSHSAKIQPISPRIQDLESLNNSDQKSLDGEQSHKVEEAPGDELFSRREEARLLLSYRRDKGHAIEDFSNKDPAARRLKSFHEQLSVFAKAERLTYEHLLDLVERNQLNKTLKFFKMFVQSVEINFNGILSKQYFQVPFVCNFITKNIKKHIIEKANRNSDDERVQHLLINHDMYYSEMRLRQQIAKIGILSQMVENWVLFKGACLVLVITLNFIMLALFSTANQIGFSIDKMPGWGKGAYYSLGTIQVILASLATIFCAIERYPISIFSGQKMIKNLEKLSKYELKKDLAIVRNRKNYFQKLRLFLRDYLGALITSEHERLSWKSKALGVLNERENYYNLGYLVLSFAARIIHPLFYSILLLDILKSSDDIQNIIKSVTLNLKQLFRAFLLGAIIMYLYAIIGYLYFSSDFINFNIDPKSSANVYCQTLFECVASIINYGLRQGGGIGGDLTIIKISDPDYWMRYFYDLTFYILCIVLLLNIIFGIIIDTFGQLRDTRKTKLINITNSCFICGLERKQFDNKGNGWYAHIFKEHNVYAYLNYIIYVQSLNLNDCNRIEKYVKELLKRSDSEFIPIGKALCFQENNIRE